MQVLEAPLVGVLDGVPDGQSIGMQISVAFPERCQVPQIGIAVAEGHGASAQYLVFVRCFLDTQPFLVVGCHEDLCFAAFAYLLKVFSWWYIAARFHLVEFSIELIEFSHFVFVRSTMAFR